LFIQHGHFDPDLVFADGHFALFVDLGEEGAVEVAGGGPEGAAEEEGDGGGDGGEAGDVPQGEAGELAGGPGRGGQDGLALGVGKGDVGFALQLGFEPGGEGLNIGDGGLLVGMVAELCFDLLAFVGGAFAEGVGGELDFVDGVHGRSP
jgi:hypothetical protein